MTAKQFLVLISILALSACSTVSQRQAAVLSKAVYATQDALKAGRFDLAQGYSALATRLLPAPPKRQPVNAVESAGQRYIVLPVEFSGTPALAIGSSALATLEKTDKTVAGQFHTDAKALAQTEHEADKVLAAKDQLAAKAEAQSIAGRASFWGRVKFWGFCGLMAAAVLTALYFFPILLPVVVTAGRSAFGVAHWLYLALVGLVKK